MRTAGKYARIFLFSAMIGTTFVGSPLLARTSEDATALRALRSAPVHARKAKSLLERQSVGEAVKAAELAVAGDPRNADYRALLGRAYLAAGRFGSAGQSFQDVIALGAGNGRVMLNLAMCHVALGDRDGALNWLERTKHSLPIADYGLGLALAGQPGAAISVLETSVQHEQAGPRERQNLALSYAMAGRWREARVVAAQDISADRVNDRMMEWAAFTSPRNSWDQVAAVLRVRARLDAGQPSALALARFPSAVSPIEAAKADAPVAAPVTVAPATDEPALASVEQALADHPPMAEGGRETAPIEVAIDPVTPVAQPVTIMRPVHARFAPKGRFVVQLGAYRTRANAQLAWGQAVARHGVLAATPALMTRVASRPLYRVAAGGFATRASAEALCNAIRHRQGRCFVRAIGGDKPAQWTVKTRAARTQIASR
jgi:Flp pilus assembly protein TadD